MNLGMGPLDAATRSAVIEQAVALGKRLQISPEQALYNYALGQGLSHSQLDTVMGFSPGSTDSFRAAQSTSTDSFRSAQQPAAPAQPPAPPPPPPRPPAPPAPPTAAAPPVPTAKPTAKPLDAATRSAVIEQAVALGKQQGISPEQALYNYAQTQGLSNAELDTVMGFSPGSAASHERAQQPAAQSAVKPLDAATRKAAIDQAVILGKQQGISPEQALYNYAKAQGLSNAQIDTVMGFSTGSADSWERSQQRTSHPVNNTPAQQPTNQQPTFQQNNLGMGTPQLAPYQKNPYLDEMAQGITSQMNDNWSRNIAPGIRSGAMAAGGFGGSRQGVVESNALNDMNRSLGQNLTSMYSQDYQQSQGRNMQKYGQDQSYNLGMSGNNLGYANLDAGIYNSNFNNQLNSGKFGLDAYNTMMGQGQQGINSATNIQNTPMTYQRYFNEQYNNAGRGGNTSTQNNPGSVVGGAIAGATLADSIANPKPKPLTL